MLSVGIHITAIVKLITVYICKEWPILVIMQELGIFFRVQEFFICPCIEYKAQLFKTNIVHLRSYIKTYRVQKY